MRSIGVGAAAESPADVGVRSLDELPVDAFDNLVNHGHV
jgi:hypothetical protein